jgi:predicted transcriptional regulator
MPLFPSLLNDPSGSAILLSVKPRFADLIVAGEKRVEFRRAAPSIEVGVIVVYASAPTSAIVAIVPVQQTVYASVSNMWAISRELGGGLTRDELRDYFTSRDNGYAFLLGDVRAFPKPIRPDSIVHGFRAPQSFFYLSPAELGRAIKLLSPRKKS